MYTSNSSAVHHSKVWDYLYQCIFTCGNQLTCINLGAICYNPQLSWQNLVHGFTLFALYKNWQSCRVPHLHSPEQVKISQTQTPAKWAITTNTTFTTQTVLCETPYCQSLRTLLHACTTRKSLSFAFSILSRQKNKLAMFTPFPLPDLQYVHG